MGKRYDKEFKIEAVRLASEPGNTQMGIERDLEVYNAQFFVQFLLLWEN